MARSIDLVLELLFLTCLVLISPLAARARPDKETMERFYGTLATDPVRNSTGDGSIADMFDRVLQKEFSENDAPEGLVSSAISFCFSFS